MAEQIIHPNEFRVSDVPPGTMVQCVVGETNVCVYNVGGTLYATQDECPHARGPLHEGELDGTHITCPRHGACFDIITGAVLKPPARKPLMLFRVIVDGEIGRVDAAPEVA